MLTISLVVYCCRYHLLQMKHWLPYSKPKIRLNLTISGSQRQIAQILEFLHRHLWHSWERFGTLRITFAEIFVVIFSSIFIPLDMKNDIDYHFEKKSHILSPYVFIYQKIISIYFSSWFLFLCLLFIFLVKQFMYISQLSWYGKLKVFYFYSIKKKLYLVSMFYTLCFMFPWL